MAPTRVALVTGGVKGIGRAICLQLASEGLRVATCYRQDKKAARDFAGVAGQTDSEFLCIRSDVTKPSNARSLVARVIKRFGRLDVLVNNVGPFLHKPLDRTTTEEWDYMTKANLSSCFYCTKAALPHLRKSRNGLIINLGGPNADVLGGKTMTAAYSAAKAGLTVLTKSLARSEAKYAVRVNQVNPGFIATSVYRKKGEDAKAVPLGRLGTPEDVAALVGYLVSERASYINGAVINVHGGLWL